jgi:hypothetical protein
MKKYRVSLIKTGSLSERLVILAALSNGNENIKIELSALKNIADINKVEYPHMNRNIDVTVGDNTLTLIDGGEVACIIEEIFMLDMPISKPDISEENLFGKPY